MSGANPLLRGPSRVWPPRPFKPATLLPARVGVGSGVTLRMAGVLVRPIEPAACGTRAAVTQKATHRWSPTDGDATLWEGGDKEVCRHETGWGQGIYSISPLTPPFVTDIPTPPPNDTMRPACDPAVRVGASAPSPQRSIAASGTDHHLLASEPLRSFLSLRSVRATPARRAVPATPAFSRRPERDPGATRMHRMVSPPPKPDETQGTSTGEAGCTDLRASHGASRRGGERSRGCTTLLTATVSLRLC